MTDDGRKAIADVLALLDLEPIEEDIFRGLSPAGRVQRVFGGQVAGQALVAASRTVESSRICHSLHAYFLRPGDPRVPIFYEVDRSRDGRSFSVRRVVAIQQGKQIFILAASFQTPEQGYEHQFPMPDVPPPEALVTVAVDPCALSGTTKVWILSEGAAPFGVAPETASKMTPRVSTSPVAPRTARLACGSMAITRPPAS